MTKRWILTACLLTALIARAQEDYHIFTDTQGRAIEAKIVSYDERYNKVTVKPKDRAAVTVPITVFSEADQEYVVEWSHTRTFLDERKLTLDFKRIKKSNSDKKRNTGSYVSNMEYKYYDHSFEIEIENKSKVDLADIEIEYVFFYEQEHHINGNRDKVLKKGTLYEKQTISLPKKSSKRISTGVVCLKRYRESGYSTVWPDLDGEMHGILIKMTMKTEDGETLVRQAVYPDRFDQKWTTETKDAQDS